MRKNILDRREFDLVAVIVCLAVSAFLLGTPWARAAIFPRVKVGDLRTPPEALITKTNLTLTFGHSRVTSEGRFTPKLAVEQKTNLIIKASYTSMGNQETNFVYQLKKIRLDPKTRKDVRVFWLDPDGTRHPVPCKVSDE